MFRRRTPVLLQVVSYLVCYLDLQKKFKVEHVRELRHKGSTSYILGCLIYLVCYLDFQEKFDVEHKRELRFCLMFSFLFSFAKEIKSWPCERVKILQVYLPSGLFVIVSWISFIVPPEVVPGYTFCFSLSLFIESLLKLLQVTGYTFHFHFS